MSDLWVVGLRRKCNFVSDLFGISVQLLKTTQKSSCRRLLKARSVLCRVVWSPASVLRLSSSDGSPSVLVTPLAISLMLHNILYTAYYFVWCQIRNSNLLRTTWNSTGCRQRSCLRLLWPWPLTLSPKNLISMSPGPGTCDPILVKLAPIVTLPEPNIWSTHHWTKNTSATKFG